MLNTNQATDLNARDLSDLSSRPREYIRRVRCFETASFERQWSVHLVKRFLTDCRRLSAPELRRIRFLERSFLIVIGQYSCDDPMRDSTVLNLARFLSHPLFSSRDEMRDFWGNTFLETVREFDLKWSPMVKRAWEQTFDEILTEIECAQRKLAESPRQRMPWPRYEIMEQALMPEPLVPAVLARESSFGDCDLVA